MSVSAPSCRRRAGTPSTIIATLVIGASAGHARVVKVRGPGRPLPAAVVVIENDLLLVPDIGPIARIGPDRATVRWRSQPYVAMSAGGATWRNRAIVVAPDGDVVVAGNFLDDGCYGGSGIVAKLSGESGETLWASAFPGTAEPGVERCAGSVLAALAVDEVGDVVGAGSLARGVNATGGSSDFLDTFVVKLHGDSGGEAWRWVRDAPYPIWDEAQHVALDPAGDVVVAGLQRRPGELPVFGETDAIVVKLTGETGAFEWETVLDDGIQPADLAVDPSGDVVVATPLAILRIGGYHARVVKLAGTDGGALWEGRAADPLADFGRFEALAIDEAADVYAVGELEDEVAQRFAVVKFAGADGARRWQREIDGTGGIYRDDEARFIALDDRGLVVVGGGIGNERTCADMAVVMLDPATGAIRARHGVDGTATASVCEDLVDCEGPGGCTGDPRSGIDVDYMTSMALVPAGDVVAAGYLVNRRRRLEGELVELSDRLAGSFARAKVAGERSRLILRSTDPGVVAPVPFSPTDPRSSGGRLLLTNPETGQTLTADLPAEGWSRRRGRKPDQLHYRYAGKGPCPGVVVSSRRGLRVKCKDPGVASLLGPAGHRSVDMTLDLGAGGRYCLAFGGTSKVDDDVRWASVDAPRPQVCSSTP